MTILIGSDRPDLIDGYLDRRDGRKGEPCAVKTPLGWTVYGPMGNDESDHISVSCTSSESNVLNYKLERLFNAEFDDIKDDSEESMSIEDRVAKEIITVKMPEVAKLDGAISNCVAMETASDKLPNENCHKDGMTDGGLVKDVGKTEASSKDLDADEGELDYDEEEGEIPDEKQAAVDHAASSTEVNNLSDKLEKVMEEEKVKKEKVIVGTASVEEEFWSQLLRRFSYWEKLRRVVAWLIRVFRRRRPEQSQDSEEQPRSDAKKIQPLTVAELEEAERKIIRRVQEESFPEDLESMKKGSLARLKPFHEDGLLRLGGRLNRSSLDHDSKHPFILPKDNTVSELIILHYHGLSGHIGSHQTLAKTRERFWITNGVSYVKRVLKKCQICRRENAKAGEHETQKWLEKKPNFSVGDLVLVVDADVQRGRWPKVLIEEVFPDTEGIVRRVTVRTANGVYQRDIRKICLLEGNLLGQETVVQT